MFAMALIALIFADLEIHHSNPASELTLMAKGFVAPQFPSWDILMPALLKTIAFAIQGVVLAGVLGFILALCFRYIIVRVVAAFIRAIHELFWALLFIQITGLSPLTAFLAILVPYSGIFAKVFSEIIEETDNRVANSINPRASYLSKVLFTRVLLCWSQIKTYFLYRMECGIRSSAILGFVGLPTLGFELESFLRQGYYHEAAGILYIFFALILSLKTFFKLPLIPIYLIAAFIYLPPFAEVSWLTVMTFFNEDIIPKVLQKGDFIGFFSWCKNLWLNEACYGVFNTLVLGQIALLCTALMSLLLFPLRSALFFSKIPRSFSNLGLIVMRSCPEYLLAFIALLVFGPSMIPAIIALSIHNSSIIAHLLALHSINLTFREDLCKGVNCYFFEVIPRLYRQFLALLFYRWEIILRETAILGMLGIPTLGFYIDSAFEDIRIDRAVFLIIISALLNISIDHIAVYCRRHLHMINQPVLKF